nr:LIM domain-containing protein WLIM1-like [Ipomoea batatas]
MAFAGTTQKCCACDKTVYLVDRLAADKRIFHKACLTMISCSRELAAWTRVSMELPRPRQINPLTVRNWLKETRSPVAVNGTAYHKACFKCSHGGCTISPSNFIAHEGKLYCKHHHIQLFREKGNYSQLENEVAAES